MISAAGDEWPAFSTEIVAPHPVSSDAFPPSLTIDTTTDFALSWSGCVAGDTVEVTLDASSAAAVFNAIICDFPADAGSAVIPSSALAGLTPDSAEASLSTVVKAHVQDDMLDLAIVAESNGADPKGAIIQGIPVFLQ